MDELNRRLKEDAANVRADVSDELSARIEASVRATDRALAPVPRPGFGYSLWWISSLTGVAAAFLIIALLDRDEVAAPSAPVEPAIAVVVPRPDVRLQNEFPLRAETAVLTEPLEEELEKLRSDIEKARDGLEQDIRKSF